MSKTPKTIRVTITEEDRTQAGTFTDCRGCLLFTALKRAGRDVANVGPYDAYIGGKRYEFARSTPA